MDESKYMTLKIEVQVSRPLDRSGESVDEETFTRILAEANQNDCITDAIEAGMSTAYLDGTDAEGEWGWHFELDITCCFDPAAL